MVKKSYNFAVWVIAALVLLALVTLFQSPRHRPAVQEISASQFLGDVDLGRVREVVIKGQEIDGRFADGQSFSTYVPNDPSLFQRLHGKGVVITARPAADEVPWLSLLVSWLPLVLFLATWMAIARMIARALRTPDGRSLGEVVDDHGSELKKLNVRLEQLTSGQPRAAAPPPPGETPASR